MVGTRRIASDWLLAIRDSRVAQHSDIGRFQVLQGLYKVEMHTVHGSRRGGYVYDGRQWQFAFIGTYQDADGDVSSAYVCHNEDPKFQPLLKTDKITLAQRRSRASNISSKAAHRSCLALPSTR
jgi:hypothetical protein